MCVFISILDLQVLILLKLLAFFAFIYEFSLGFFYFVKFSRVYREFLSEFVSIFTYLSRTKKLYFILFQNFKIRSYESLNVCLSYCIFLFENEEYNVFDFSNQTVSKIYIYTLGNKIYVYLEYNIEILRWIKLQKIIVTAERKWYQNKISINILLVFQSFNWQ